METLVITACVDVSPKLNFVSIVDKKERLEQYLETLRWAFEESKFDNIIFCDNSNYLYDYDAYIKKLKYKNKNYEIFTFNGSPDVNKYGKGYGESEIINYVLKHSKMLKNEKYFWKITGRLIVTNINKVMEKTKNSTYFLSWVHLKGCLDTRFYKIDKEVYNKYLLNAYKNVNDREGNVLEKYFYYTLKNNKVKYKYFKVYPIINGISGSTGIDYKISRLKINIYKLLCKTGIYNTQLFANLIQILKK